MSERRQGIIAGLGLGGLALLGALVVMLLWDGGGNDTPEPTVTNPSGIQAYADLDRYKVHFGDTLTAKVEVSVDNARVDPDSIRINTDFTPWKAVGASNVVRRDGESTTYLETRYTLRCLESFCTTPDAESVQGFRAARITYTALDRAAGGAGSRTVQAAWPQILVTARYAPPSASESSRQARTQWRANLLSLPAATYRIGPWALVTLLLAGAALLAAAAVLIVLRTRPRPSAAAVAAAPAGYAAPGISPLEYALELLEDPSRVNGSGDQRRALELVADGLFDRGNGALARIARALAWSRPVPKIDETSGIARKARAVFGRRRTPMRLSSSGSAVDSHDVGTMRRATFRTRLVRVVLVVAALALLIGAAASARGLDAGRTNGLPTASGVAVVDLSLSIGPQDYRTIRATVRRLIASNGSLGLVMFSDVPYEMLPPGTPARELEPLLRLLAPQKAAAKRGPVLPDNPWSQSFSAGTRISSALELAHDMLVRDGISHGTVLLLSDLVTAPEDVPRLARTLQELQDAGISVKVVPLNPLKDGRTIFEGLLGKQALIPPSRIASSQPLPTDSSSGLPIALLFLGALVLVALAAHERFAGRLWLPRPEGRPA